MQDAGEQILEEAGHALQDAGGQILTDAGQVLQDAGQATADAADAMLQDATAQSCGNCTAGGFQQVVTADTDWSQIEGGTIEGDGWTRLYGEYHEGGEAMAYFIYKRLTDGPFVLTDILGRTGTVEFYAVKQPNDCFAPFETGYGGTGWEVHPDASTVIDAASDTRIHGARIIIQADETLCAFSASGSDLPANPEVSTTDKVLWSGFRPYE